MADVMNRRVGMCLAWALTGGGLISAAEIKAPRPPCDPICEIRAQDGAFSLLVESYRQFQSHLIEGDYQTRLRAADTARDGSTFVIESSSKAMLTLRQYIFALARMERDVRYEQLETQCRNFHAAYSCVRKLDEEAIGQTVASEVDQRAAAKKLKDFCVVVPGGALAQAKMKTADCLPASTVLLDAPPVAPNPKQLVEHCE